MRLTLEKSDLLRIISKEFDLETVEGVIVTADPFEVTLTGLKYTPPPPPEPPPVSETPPSTVASAQPPPPPPRVRGTRENPRELFPKANPPGQIFEENDPNRPLQDDFSGEVG